MTQVAQMFRQRSLHLEAGMIRSDRSPHIPYRAFAISSEAAAITASGVNPNFFCNSLSGADAPKVCMPIVRPAYRSQPTVDACSTDTRAFTLGGRTLSL